MSGSGSTRYKGVRMRKWGKWVSEIRERHRRAEARTNRIWLGSFRSAEEAAHAYDAALLCCRGRTSANLNFPNYNYNIPPGTPGSYSIREIQAAAAAAAADYAGRPFSYSNFMAPAAESSSSDDDDEVEDITYDEEAQSSQPSWADNNWSPYDDPNYPNSAPGNDDDDDDEDSDEDSDDDEPRLWG